MLTCTTPPGQSIPWNNKPSPELQDQCLTIRGSLASHRTLVWGRSVLPRCEYSVVVFYSLSRLATELTKLRNMRMMVIPIIVGTLGTVLINLERRMEELEITRRIETNQTTELLRSAIILRRVLETYRDPNERPSANTRVKISPGVRSETIQTTWWSSEQK